VFEAVTNAARMLEPLVGWAGDEHSMECGDLSPLFLPQKGTKTQLCPLCFLCFFVAKSGDRSPHSILIP
jgi:hypothetical protein